MVNTMGNTLRQLALTCAHGVNITALFLWFIEGGDLEPRDFYLSADVLGLFYNEQVQCSVLRCCIICRESIQDDRSGRECLHRSGKWLTNRILSNGIDILSQKNNSVTDH